MQWIVIQQCPFLMGVYLNFFQEMVLLDAAGFSMSLFFGGM